MRWPASSAGHLPTALCAYYVACPAATGWDGRLIALAGTAMDVVTAFAADLGWRCVQGDFARLALWIVFTVKGMVAAGYWLVSGVFGLGDWASSVRGGMGAMPRRMRLAGVGLFAYIAVTRLSIRSSTTCSARRGLRWRCANVRR